MSKQLLPPKGFVRDYRDGVSIKELARRYGVCRSTVQKWAVMRGLPTRKRAPWLEPEEQTALRDMVYQGYAVATIAHEFKRSVTVIKAAMEELDLVSVYNRRHKADGEALPRFRTGPKPIDQLCWRCGYANGSGDPPCPWTAKAPHLPEGCEAIPQPNDGYLILSCPRFTEG